MVATPQRPTIDTASISSFGTARSTIAGTPLTAEELQKMQAFWHAANCESFAHVIGSMVGQHAKWLEICNPIHWQEEVDLLNSNLISSILTVSASGTSTAYSHPTSRSASTFTFPEDHGLNNVSNCTDRFSQRMMALPEFD